MSATKLIRKPAAKRDLIDHFVYLGEQAGVGVADDFLIAVRRAFERLSRNPEVGFACEFPNPAWKSLRRWPVPGFTNYLIFYRHLDPRVEIVRVLHGSRDLATIFNPS